MKNILSLLLLLSTTIVFSQENIPYQKPSSEILELVEFDRPPAVIYDDDKNYLVFLYRDNYCLLYTSPSPRDKRQSRMPSSA